MKQKGITLRNSILVTTKVNSTYLQNFPRLFSNLISSNVIYIIHKSRHTFHLAFEKRIIEESLTQR